MLVQVFAPKVYKAFYISSFVLFMCVIFPQVEQELFNAFSVTAAEILDIYLNYVLFRDMGWAQHKICIETYICFHGRYYNFCKAKK